MSINPNDIPFTDPETLRRVAVEDAVLLLEQVHTGTDFDLACQEAAEHLKQVFGP